MINYADEVRKLLGEQGIFRAPIPVEQIATAKGIEIREATGVPSISGALITDSGRPVIAVNSSQHKNRQRFTIAHEFAHYHLSHPADHVDEDFTISWRDENSSTASNPNEIEANQFAAELLMPQDMILRDIVDASVIDDSFIEKQAKKYQVSTQAMTFRLVNLGVISPL